MTSWAKEELMDCTELKDEAWCVWKAVLSVSARCRRAASCWVLLGWAIVRVGEWCVGESDGWGAVEVWLVGSDWADRRRSPSRGFAGLTVVHSRPAYEPLYSDHPDCPLQNQPN